MAKNIGFSEYANFRNSDSAPNLPLDPSLTTNDLERRISSGAFSLTYPLNHASVVKVTRLLRLGEKTNTWSPQHSDIIPYLVSKGDAGDKVNFEKAVIVAREYAEVRRQIYELLRSHLGPHLPTLKGQAVFDSPRRILEN